MVDTRVATADDLTRFVEAVFLTEGMSADHAASVARRLVLANLRGLDTHGVARVPAYLTRIRKGMIDLTAEPIVDSPRPFSTVVDGRNAMGPVVAEKALNACIEAAEKTGVGMATARHSNHFGAASAYTLPAAEAGYISMAMSPGAKTLAPYGSRAPLLGTNPFAFAAPAGRYAPWSLDMASSVAARGHMRLAAQAGKPIPHEWALNARGEPTTDPHEALEGVLLPFGGAKGSAFAMMVEILSGALSGSALVGEVKDWNRDFSGPADVGHFFMVLAIDAFMPKQSFESRMEIEVERLKALPPAEGFSEILYPGERGARTQRHRLQHGIPLPDETVVALNALATKTGYPLSLR